MKSKILLVILSLVITISAVAGATYAWFMDSEASNGNTFTTGTVNIQVDRDMGDAVPGPMFYITNEEGASANGAPGMYETGLWSPGKTVIRQLDVRNIGSLKVRINQVKAEIESINNAAPSSSPELTSLADSFAESMNVKIYVAGHQTDLLLYDGSLATLRTAQNCLTKPPLEALVPGYYPSVLQLCYEVTMMENAGNDLQGIKPVVTFWVGAEQTANNP